MGVGWWVEEVEGALGVGDDTDRLGAAQVQAVAVPESGQGFGDLVEGVVEQLHVEGVGLDPDRHRAVGHLLADPDPATLGAVPLATLGGLGVEPAQRHLDEVEDPLEPDPVGERSQLGVHEPGRLLAQVLGVRRDLPGPPGLQLPALHPRPQPRQPVPQLQGVPDQQRPGMRGQAERGPQLTGRELRHLRGAVPGQRHQLLDPLDQEPAQAEPRRGPTGQHRMQVRPVRGDREQVRLRPVSSPPAPHRSAQRTRRIQVPHLTHAAHAAPVPLVVRATRVPHAVHVFEYRPDHRHWTRDVIE